MKKQILGSILLMSIALTVGMTSCNEVEAEELATSPVGLVTVDENGSTELDEQSIMENYAGKSTEISDELADWLKFMREEEKLARDVYAKFFDMYEYRVFGNILKAEQNHMDAILTYLIDYELEDPASVEAGVFNDEKLQELYDELVEKGSANVEAALKVGALIEEVDIIDLAEVYELNPEEDIIALTEALMLGSRNHLRAFTRILGFRDIVYAPELLSSDDYNQIIEQGWERGTGLCRKIDTSDGSSYRYGAGKGFWKGQ